MTFQISETVKRIDESLGTCTAVIAYCEEPIVHGCMIVFEKVAIFIKNNWQPLIAYLVAWGTIISCTGLMYGFQAVALPLSIGLGLGLAFGLIAGTLTVCIRPSGELSLWNFLNHGIERLDPNGTRQIVLAVAVTVLLAAAVVFPYVIGAIIGIVVGHQVATKIGSGKNLGTDPEKIKASFKQKMDTMQQQIDKMQNEIISIKNNEEKEKLSQQILGMIDQLQKMRIELQTLYPPTVGEQGK